MSSGLLLRFAWPGVILLLISLAGLTGFTLFRHASRGARLQRLGELRTGVEPVLLALFAGTIEYERGLNRLRTVMAGCSLRLLEELLIVDRDPPEERVAILRRLSEDLGLVDAWQSRLLGESKLKAGGTGLSSDRFAHPLSFVRRAEAAESLGIIRHRPSWPLLVEALSDPHVTVRSVAASALAQIAEPESFARLAEELRDAAREPFPEISSGALAMALTAFPLANAGGLRDLLEDAHAPVRAVAACVISAMVEREASVSPKPDRQLVRLPSDLHDFVINRLASDSNPEVRARAAEIAGYVDDVRCVPLLRALVEDPEWFVRLHAVRAMVRHRLA